MKGNQSYTTPGGVTFRTNGMTVTDFNQGLRLPQMRTFLGPEYWNAGCTSLYCKDSTMCPGGTNATTCAPTGDMFNYLFESHSDFTGNDAPPACFGGLCSGYSSVLGWETSNTGMGTKWQAQGSQPACGETFV